MYEYQNTYVIQRFFASSKVLMKDGACQYIIKAVIMTPIVVIITAFCFKISFLPSYQK